MYYFFRQVEFGRQPDGVAMKIAFGSLLCLLGLTALINGAGGGGAWMVLGGGTLVHHGMTYGDRMQFFGWHIGWWAFGALLVFVIVTMLLNPDCCGPGLYDGEGPPDRPYYD
jgi:hypothetical protein